MARQCELCELPARMHCESDRASLCWECDARVHGANFLVARHLRRLLCRLCQSPTPWRASGPRLGPTVSLCQHCQGAGDGRECEAMEKGERESGGDLGAHGEGEREDEEEDEDTGDEEGEEEGENQVVPLSMLAVTPPPVASCSSSDETSSERTAVYADAERHPPPRGHHRPSPSHPAAVHSSRWGMQEPGEGTSPCGDSFRALDDPPARVGSRGQSDHDRNATWWF